MLSKRVLIGSVLAVVLLMLGTVGTAIFDKGALAAVTLVSFTATGGDGQVLIEWETASEINNIGFNLWRSTREMGDYVKLNDLLIPSQALGSVIGASYSYMDTAVVGGTTYYYKLESIATDGSSELHGPISATPGAQPTATPTGTPADTLTPTAIPPPPLVELVSVERVYVEDQGWATYFTFQGYSFTPYGDVEDGFMYPPQCPPPCEGGWQPLGTVRASSAGTFSRLVGLWDTWASGTYQYQAKDVVKGLTAYANFELTTPTPTPTTTPTPEFTPTPVWQVYLPFIRAIKSQQPQVSNFHLSNVPYGPEVFEFASGTPAIYVIFDYTDADNLDLMVKIFDGGGYIIFEKRDVYNGSGTRSMAVSGEEVFKKYQTLAQTYGTSMKGYIDQAVDESTPTMARRLVEFALSSGTQLEGVLRALSDYDLSPAADDHLDQARAYLDQALDEGLEIINVSITPDDEVRSRAEVMQSLAQQALDEMEEVIILSEEEGKTFLDGDYTAIIYQHSNIVDSIEWAVSPHGFPFTATRTHRPSDTPGSPTPST